MRDANHLTSRSTICQSVAEVYLTHMVPFGAADHRFDLKNILLVILLVSRPNGLQKITCISSLCSCDKLSFPHFSIFSLLFQLPIFSCVSQIKSAFFFLFLLLLPSSKLQQHHEESILFLQYVQSNWIFYAGFVQKRPVLYVKEFVHQLVTLFHSHPEVHYKAFEIHPPQLSQIIGL